MQVDWSQRVFDFDALLTVRRDATNETDKWKPSGNIGNHRGTLGDVFSSRVISVPMTTGVNNAMGVELGRDESIGRENPVLRRPLADRSVFRC